MRAAQAAVQRIVAPLTIATVTLALLATPAAAQPSDLSDAEVAALFDAQLPAVSAPPPVPAITGNRAADRRIARLARARGYQPRGEPLDGLGSYQGRPLQQRAIDDLVAMQDAMRREAGTSFALTSAYRSVSTQRGLFLSRLAAAGSRLRGAPVSATAIADGRADDVVDAVMATTAPPGFSKHHTGYAIDAAGGFGFASTAASRWLSADRYANAMRFGWIPSYPPEAGRQGPNPEPWEWVWIGRPAAACARTRSCPTGEVEVSPLRTNRAALRGWTVSAAPLRRQIRVVTAQGNATVRTTRVERFNVDEVFAADATGFVARTRLRASTSWFCVEVRPARQRSWQRLTCQVR